MGRHRRAHSPGPPTHLGAVVLLLLCRAQQTSGSVKVEVPRKPLTVHVNDTVTIPCKFHSSSEWNTSLVSVIWFKGAETKVFELHGNTENIMRPGAEVSRERLQRGDASLNLHGVQLEDSGMYRCQVVVTPEMTEGTVSLEVLASPDCTLFLKQTIEKNNESLVCQCCGFYPEDINIRWETYNHNSSQGQRMSTGFWTEPIIKNEDGTFTITSYLETNPFMEGNLTTYLCVVRHPSLSTSWRLNITVSMGETDKTPLDVSECMWSLASVLSTVILFMTLFGFFMWRGFCPDQPIPNSDTGEESTALARVAICRDESAPSRGAHIDDANPADRVPQGGSNPSGRVCTNDSNPSEVLYTDDSHPSHIVYTDDCSPSCVCASV